MLGVRMHREAVSNTPTYLDGGRLHGHSCTVSVAVLVTEKAFVAQANEACSCTVRECVSTLNAVFTACLFLLLRLM